MAFAAAFLLAQPVRADDSWTVEATRKAKPTPVHAIDTMAWMDRFGIATGWNKDNLAYFRLGGFRNLRTETSINRELRDLVDQDGTRVMLIAPNLPVQLGEAARPMFQQWKSDVRSWLLAPATKFDKKDPRRLVDLIDAVEGLNERDRVTCKGMITGQWPCAGWQGNFIDSAVYLHEVVQQVDPTLPIVGPSLVTPRGGESVRNTFRTRWYLNRDLKLSNLSAYVTSGNFHSYGGLSALRENWSKNASPIYPGRPQQVSEWGIYSIDAARPSGAAWANLILDVIRFAETHGLDRIYLYGLIEKRLSPVDALIWRHSDGGLEPTGAFWTLANLNRQFRYARDKDPGERDWLSYSVTRGNYKSALYQAGQGGDFQILLWGDSKDAPEITLDREGFVVSSTRLEESDARTERILPERDGKLLRYQVPLSPSRYPILVTVQPMEQAGLALKPW